MSDRSFFRPDDPILAIDLCLGACVVAAEGVEGSVLLEEPMTRGHQERLAPLVRDAVARSGLQFNDLRRVGVTVGPGSFTGLRVGLSFAKTLALALGIECVGFSSLSALAVTVKAQGVVVAVIPSRQDQFFVQMFSDGAAVTAPDLLTETEIAARLAEVWTSGGLTLVGPGAEALQALSLNAQMSPSVYPSAQALLALTRSASRPLSPPRPLYLRAPDARTMAERQALG